MKRVIVIGAGVAGLAAAARLQHAGYEVTLFEKEPLVGGKMNQIREEGFTFDVGPTIVMMPELYREVFETCGRNADDYIPMEKVEPLMDISFGPGDRLRLSNDLASMTAAVEAVGEKDAQGYFEYLALLYKRYLIAKDNFLQRSFRKPIDFYNPKSLVAGLRLHTLRDADSSVAHHVKDDRLRLEQGGELRTSTPVERIVVENGCACGVEAGGAVHYADYVVCDADFPYAITQLVDEADARGKYTPQKIEEMEYSCSCFILYLGLDKRYPSDAVHSIRFASDFERNIDDIFDDARFPDDPSFYCYAPSSLDRSLAPEGCSTLYVLVPVPPLSPASPRWSDAEVAEYRDRVLDLMERETVYEDVRDHIVFERAYTPLDFAERFNAYDGATFGLRPTLGQSNYWRPHNKATDCSRLYFCGSSVHPGAGVPIVLLSAKLAAEELMRDDRL